MKRIVTFFCVALLPPLADAEPVSFRKDIAPILLDNRLACHGPKKADGSFRIDSFQRVTSKGDSDTPGFTANNLDASEIYQRLITDDEDSRMPLEADPLSAEQIALVKRWIEEGANYDAGDPKALLSAIVPPPVHPSAPQAYPNTMPITAVAFSPDGQLSVGGYHELTVWNPADGAIIRRIGNVGEHTYSGHGQPVKGVAFHPDGAEVYSSATDKKIHQWKIADGKKSADVGSFGGEVYKLTTSGDFMFVGSADKSAKQYELKTRKEVRAYSGHQDWVLATAYQGGTKRLATGSFNGEVRIWNAEDGKPVVTFLAAPGYTK